MNKITRMASLLLLVAVIAVGCRKEPHMDIKYTVVFNANGGAGEMEAQIFNRGETNTLKACTFINPYHDFLGWNTEKDGSGTAYADEQELTPTKDIKLYAQWKMYELIDGHAYVDLGLPSGTLWATCNVGASNPANSGSYYAWGETVPQSDIAYSWTSYKYANGTSGTDPQLTKYCSDPNYGDVGYVDTLTVLVSEDDPATVNWGNGWRTPTKQELTELKNRCTIAWTTQNGVNGYIFTGPSGRSIFMPASGVYNNGAPQHVGVKGFYQCNMLYTVKPTSAWNFVFEASSAYLDNVKQRYCGMTVRPVCVVKK